MKAVHNYGMITRFIDNYVRRATSTFITEFLQTISLTSIDGREKLCTEKCSSSFASVQGLELAAQKPLRSVG
jgi:hypothetical protein